MIKIVEENIEEHINEYDFILCGTNINQVMSNGFQHYVKLYYPYVYEQNMETRYGDIKRMGTILECKENNEPIFILCFITKGMNYRPDLSSDYLDYDALEICLKTINILYKGKKIASPILGTSRFDGNGDRDKILDIFNKTLTNVDITLYNYFQESRDERLVKILKEESKIKEVDRKKYYEMVRKRKEEAEKRFQRNKKRRY